MGEASRGVLHSDNAAPEHVRNSRRPPDFQECCFLYAPEPHWLEEANAGAIAPTDTGLVSRNIAIAEKLAVILLCLMGERGAGRYVDLAGGYGLLTRLMRDHGFDFSLHDKCCENILARGFEFSPERGPCRAETAFEVLEHTEYPAGFLESALGYGQADTRIFSTQLFEGSPSSPQTWWYYSLETGHQISFFQRRALQVLARKMDLDCASNGWLAVFSKDRINEVMPKMHTGRLSKFAPPKMRRKMSGRIRSDHDNLVAGSMREGT